MYFSERQGLISKKTIQIESMDSSLINRLWNAIRKVIDESGKENALAYILDKKGISIIEPCLTYENAMTYYFKYWKENTWNMCYDDVEILLEYIYNFDHNALIFVIRDFNRLLEEEKAGYRIINCLVTPITNNTELQSIEETLDESHPFENVNNSLNKALRFYSDRENPDYHNSIKESISAVESMCGYIIQDDKSLGKALKKLKDKGIYIHPAMENGFNQLYGYTSDENGIRHNGMKESEVKAEDAKYMLVTCSAFVNYLMEKYSQIQGA